MADKRKKMPYAHRGIFPTIPVNILITGGLGFIGVNSAKRFLEKGWSVTVLDNFSRMGTEVNRAFLEKDYEQNLEILEGDIRTDQELLAKLAEDHDAILHLAAQVAVTTSVKEPRSDFETNALGTLNVLEAVRLSKRKPIVLYASTNKVYGALEHVAMTEMDKRYAFETPLAAIDESQLLDFHSPYGCSKGSADQYVRDYARLYDLRTVVFRQSCIYGPHQLGVEDQGWVAWFLIAAMFSQPVQIYGNGKQVRDLLHVDDLVTLYELAIEKINGCRGRAYNIGGGPTNTLSLLEFMDFLTEDLQLRIEYSFAGTRPGDQPIFISDNRRAMSDLGWRPTIGVFDGIRSLRNWLWEHRGELETFYARRNLQKTIITHSGKSN